MGVALCMLLIVLGPAMSRATHAQPGFIMSTIESLGNQIDSEGRAAFDAFGIHVHVVAPSAFADSQHPFEQAEPDSAESNDGRLELPAMLMLLIFYLLLAAQLRRTSSAYPRLKLYTTLLASPLYLSTQRLRI
ncbi:MAG: hypothetical protein P8Y64_08490 [Gammaproteobacteria bacterium]|jgi:hypothetical protein